MITKERLKELIEQGATIYDIFKGDIYLVDLTMAKYYDVPKYIEYKNDYYNCNLTRNIGDLFETKEQAEWHLKMTRTRTETLELPMWEDVQEMLKANCSIYEIIKKYDIELVIEKSKYFPAQIKLYADNEKFNWNLSKENYIEACELCLRLFSGEVDDE